MTLQLGHEIGRGADGTVYAALSRAHWAAKIYREDLAAQRHKKIKAMVDGGWSTNSSAVTFPIDALFAGDGRFVGFTMRRIGYHQPIHRLYATTRRKLEFPTANFRFLTQVAANAARAVAAVHQTGCVVGGVNHSEFLVARNGAVTLVDTDSFQVPSRYSLFPCKTGAPEFLAPELQGRSIAPGEWTENHDCFGLAVLIFQLLFLGRHPYAGTPLEGGDLQLADAISNFRFAFSPDQSETAMQPPPGVPKLADLPPSIALAFQTAFQREGQIADRPSAADWVCLLEEAKTDFIVCRSNPAHHYYRQADECPWCRMEAAYPGLILFPSPVRGPVLRATEIGGLLAALKAVGDPGPPPEIAKLLLSPANLLPSSEALFFKGQKRQRYLAAAGGGCIALLALVVAGSLPGFLFVAAITLLLFRFIPDRSGQLKANRHSAETRFLKIAEQITNSGTENFASARKRAAEELQHLAILAADEKRRINELSQTKREAQFTRFLEEFRIDSAAIQHIGRSRRLILASYGIETAADVTLERLQTVSGFGPTITEALLAWRRTKELSFKYDAQDGLDEQEIARIQGDLTRAKANGVSAVRKRIRELDEIAESIRFHRRALHLEIQGAYRELKQAEKNLSAVNSVLSGWELATLALLFLLAGLGWFSTAVLHRDGPLALPKIPARLEVTMPAEESLPIQPRAQIGEVKLARTPPPAPMRRIRVGHLRTMSNANRSIIGPRETKATFSARPIQMSPVMQPRFSPFPFGIAERSHFSPDLVEGARSVQERLIQLGYLQGIDDGVWGRQSQEALRAFKVRAKLGNDSFLSAETEKLLFAAEAPRKWSASVKRRIKREHQPSPFAPAGLLGN